MTYGIKHRALKAGISFDIDANYLLELFERQDGCCAYTGRKMLVEAGKGHRADGISVDRIDSAKGYTKDNVQLVCFVVNMAKQKMSHSEFITMCRDVSGYSQ